MTMPDPAFYLSSESGFFSMIFRVCTVYLHVGPRLGLDTRGWFHGRWNWYFQSLHDRTITYDTPYFTMTSLQPYLLKWTLGDYRRVLHELLQLTPLLRVEVKSVIAKIGRPYTALFVRRGDKVVEEAPFLSMETILSWISYTDDTVFFVQTDDYAVIEEMRALLPNHTIHHTVPSTKRGSYHSRAFAQTVSVPWAEKTPEEARAETNEMLVGLFVCLAAETCWTDDTSNVGRFLKLYDTNNRVRVYPTDYSIDESLHLHPAWSLRT